ncbi:PUR family DNA/RNA-binding protein [Flavobacteriales bacterium]|nr:PUR family DNA/RNA-binding protein [Flavobacteriales bacterium]
MEDKMPYRDEIFSKAVRAGKRTYFFDVKTTKGNDLYLTITESKKKTNHDGKSHYEKHKIFLYKEDFEKFSLGFDEAIDKIQELKDQGDFPELSTNYSSNSDNASNQDQDYTTDVKFDDLG